MSRRFQEQRRLLMNGDEIINGDEVAEPQRGVIKDVRFYLKYSYEKMSKVSFRAVIDWE